MKTYARIQDGAVAEIILPATDEEGNEVPIAERFHADLVATMIDVTNVAPMPTDHWLAAEVDGVWKFSAPTD
jgi:hypothetical protein